MTEGDGKDVLTVLDDDYATEILVETYVQPRSARRLAEHCDASRSTIYQRIERLQAHDLLETWQEIDPDGHHREVYATSLQRVTVELTAEGYDVTIDRAREDAASRFTRLYEEFTGES